MIAIKIKDGGTPYIRRIVAALQNPETLHTLAGRAVQQDLKRHLQNLNRERHRSPNKVVGFYATAADSTTFKADKKEAIVSVAHLGIRQRLYGGPIRPVNVKYLTIPARDEALDKRAREFDDLVVLFGRRGPWALVKAPQTALFGKRGQRLKKPKVEGGEIMFWLVKGVNQKPDPSVLPTDSQMKQVAVTELLDYIAEVQRRTKIQ